jgi:hypothetical protein
MTRDDSKRIKSTRNIGSTIALMTLSFYICWTPYAIRCILELFGINIPAWQSTLTVLFAKLGVIINPILYIFSNKQVNHCLANIFCRTFNLLRNINTLHIAVIEEKLQNNMLYKSRYQPLH